MAAKIYNTGRHNTDHSMYSGEIEWDDFNTNTPNKNRIANQAAANNMPSVLQENIRKQKELEKYKNMTIEELREQKLISNTNGRPSSTLTDEKWQKEFTIRKLFITPYQEGTTKILKGKYSKESGSWTVETQGEYYGTTSWQSYCAYINDVLQNIRRGQIDYCYFIFQIQDLLKFHFDDLRTRYRDGYWEVWLER